MKLKALPQCDLTYCTNIHAASGWRNVLKTLEQYAPALKARLAPDEPFGIGLRLSSEESVELLQDGNLEEFRRILAERNCYVAVINGFPYGSFHNRVIKQDVFAPDWQMQDRLEYTLRLVKILSTLLPKGMDGGISTSPLSYKGWFDGAPSEWVWQVMTENIVKSVAAMVEVRRRTGQMIHLDIEPEPDGLIENTDELIAYFADWLLPIGAPNLAELAGISHAEAEDALQEHVQVCFDTCHFSIENENAAAALARFAEAGIKIGRVQVSAALEVDLPAGDAARAEIAKQLETFAESTYLHQVIECRAGGELRHYPDLALALPNIYDPEAILWRVHFHVPLFVDEYHAVICSTRQEIEDTFAYLHAHPETTTHLEIETYTWDILPPELKEDNLAHSIEHEYRWVLGALGEPVGQPGEELAARA